MPELSTENLFRQWRETRDATALATLYDRTAPRLLMVASHLAKRPADAEDAVQGTFLEVLQHADRWDQSRPLEPWLLGILGNVVRRGRRSHARQPSATPTIDRAEEDDPSTHAACEEFDAALDSAIDDLPEVYRPVLVLRLKHGFEPADIAHTLRRAPGTVRSQLHRGLDLLRKALPAGFAASFALVVTPTAGLAAVKKTVLAKAGVGTVAATTAGGTVFAKKHWLLAACAAILATTTGALLWSDPPDEPETVVSASVGTVPETGDAAEDESIGRAETPTATERDEVHSGGVRVRVTCGGEPAVNCHLRLAPLGKRTAFATAATDDDGFLEFDRVPPGSYSVGVTGGSTRLRVRSGEVTEAELELERFVRVRVRVIDPAGAPVAGALVFHSYRDEPQAELGETDAAGYLESAVLSAIPAKVGARVRGFAAQSTNLHGQPGSLVEAEIRFGPRGGAIRGVVHTHGGAPAKDARVVVGLPSAQVDHRDRTASATNAFETRTNEDGEFDLFGLTPGTVRLSVDHRTHAPWSNLATIPTGRAHDLTVDLQRGVTVSGTVRNEAGEPMAKQQVALRVFRGQEIAERTAESDAKGNYTLRALPAGHVRLQAGRPGGDLLTWHTIEAAPGDELRWDPVLGESNSRMRGTLLDIAGTPIRNAFVVPFRADQERSGWSAKTGLFRTDENGAFDVSPGFDHNDRLYDLEFHLEEQNPEGGWPETPPIHVVTNVAPGTDGIEVRVPDADMPSAWIRGRLIDMPGSGWLELLDEDNGRQVVHHKNGKFEVGPLPPRKFTLRLRGRRLIGTVELSPREVREFEWTYTRTENSRDPGAKRVRRTFFVPAPAGPRTSVDVRAVDARGETVAEAEARARGSAGLRATLELPAGSFRVVATDRTGREGEVEILVRLDQSAAYPTELRLR